MTNLLLPDEIEILERYTPNINKTFGVSIGRTCDDIRTLLTRLSEARAVCEEFQKINSIQKTYLEAAEKHEASLRSDLALAVEALGSSLRAMNKALAITWISGETEVGDAHAHLNVSMDRVDESLEQIKSRNEWLDEPEGG